MIYEIIGKIFVTLLIMIILLIGFFILLVIGSLLKDWIENSFPEWLKTTIGITGILLILIFVFITILGLL